MADIELLSNKLATSEERLSAAACDKDKFCIEVSQFVRSAHAYLYNALTTAHPYIA